MNPEAEEYATLFARIEARLRAKDRAPSDRMKTNFWKDWSRTLTTEERKTIRSMESCRFGSLLSTTDKPLKVPQDKRKDKRKEKEKEKEKEKHSTALVDGKPQSVKNYRAEGSSVFVGRDPNHALTGRIKRRVEPGDVTLNLSKGVKVPSPPYGKWRGVVHDPLVDWLASWKDPLSGVVKYTKLGAGSDLEQRLDRDKFELARKLKTNLPMIMKRIRADIDSSTSSSRMQLACCFWLMLETAVRVGTRTENQTYGLTTLQVRHVTFLPDSASIRLSFLGKDHVPFDRRVNLDGALIRGLRRCAAGKSPHEELFDAVDHVKFNEFLVGVSRLEGMTAKVIRTYRASSLFEASLKTMEVKKGPLLTKAACRTVLQVAGLRAAHLCNHRRAVVGLEQRRKMQSSSKSSDDEIGRAIDGLERMNDVDLIRKEVGLIIKDGSFSLATSRANYIDPRIPVSFCLRHGCDVKVALPGALIKRFSWAVEESTARFAF